jgi:ribosomal-protein-alanine N-acetyltransferase
MPDFPFHPFPEHRTKRLLLRELRLSDVPAISKLRSDEAVNRYLGRPREHDPAQAEAFIRKIQTAVREGHSMYWAVCLQTEEDLIGTVCLWNFMEDQQSAEIGYELLPTYQGRGLMQEAVEAVLTYAFRTLNLHQVLACTHPGNESSIKLLIKKGFRPVSDPEASLTETFYALKKQPA